MEGESDLRPLAERYRPQRLRDLVGNARAVRGLRQWGESWANSGGAPPAKRAALLEGPAGVGKTTSALALAAEFGWTVVEMNASDARNQDAIAEVAGRASLTNTLGSSGTYRSSREGGLTLILLDEADCLSGRATETASARPSPPSLREFLRGRYRTVEALVAAWGLGAAGAPAAFASWEAVPASAGRAAWTRLPAAQRDLADWKGASRPSDSTDRGGLAAIARLVRETRQPLVLTVNDPQPLLRYSPVFRQSVARLYFDPVDPPELRAHLLRIIAKERWSIPKDLLDRIVDRSHGDVRAALTDLEAIAVRPTGETAELLWGARDQMSSLGEFVSAVLGDPRLYRNGEIRGRLDAPPDDLLPWVEENLPRSASSAARRYDAFEVLARADQFLRWAQRYRVWGLWPYASELLTGGVSLALAGDGPGARSQGAAFPEFLGAMGSSRVRRGLRSSIASKAAGRFHLSRRKASEVFLPYLDRVFRGVGATEQREQRIRTERRTIVRELGLNAEEVGYLLALEPDSDRVAALLGRPESVASAEEAPREEPPKSTERSAPRRVQRRLGEFGR